MKYTKAIFISILLAVTSAGGAAFAQGSAGGGGTAAAGGANGGGGSAGGNANGPNTPSNAVAGPTASTGTSMNSTSTHKRTMKKHHAKKPMTDRTNMPGADASSDTKGQ